MANVRDISFASFNLYNLQVPNKPTHTGTATFTEETYEKRLKWASAILHQLDADVIAFQELWSAQALRNLFDGAGLADAYELHLIGDSWYDIAVAAAVRKPWQATGKDLHKSFPEEFRLVKRAHGDEGAQRDRTDDDIDVQIQFFSRTVMELTLARDGVDDLPALHVLCAHLKSKLPTNLDPVEAQIDALKPHRAALGAALSTIRRTAEAAALRMILTRLTKSTDRAVALIGDLNDGAHSNRIAILSAQPRFRRRHKSTVGQASDAEMYPATLPAGPGGLPGPGVLARVPGRAGATRSRAGVRAVLRPLMAPLLVFRRAADLERSPLRRWPDRAAAPDNRPRHRVCALRLGSDTHDGCRCDDRRADTAGGGNTRPTTDCATRV